MKPVPAIPPSVKPSIKPSIKPSATQGKIDQRVDSHRPLLPHERDEKPDQHPSAPRKIMKQAYQDLQRGLVDTDMHGQRGVENVVKPKNAEGKK